jgi:transportin-1
MPALLHHLQPNNSNSNPNALQGSLSAIRKMMEDGPSEIPTHHLDALVPLLLHIFRSNDKTSKVAALQSLVACLASGVVPSALVVQFSDYLQGLSSLASDPSPQVRKWVCQSTNTLMECHTQYIAPQMPSICQFMLQSTTLQNNDESVAMEACEFWLLVATLDESLMTSDMIDTVKRLLPQLIPVLLTNVVYSEEQRLELEVRNEMDMEEQPQQAMKPVFHRTKHKRDGQGGDDEQDLDDDDYDDDLDDDDNKWNLRKYAGASLDSLANLYGAGPILPPLLPAVQQGLSSTDPWIQEASILALGAIAGGCREEMSAHMGELYPYLMNLLATPRRPSICPKSNVFVRGPLVDMLRGPSSKYKQEPKDTCWHK